MNCDFVRLTLIAEFLIISLINIHANPMNFGLSSIMVLCQPKRVSDFALCQNRVIPVTWQITCSLLSHDLNVQCIVSYYMWSGNAAGIFTHHLRLRSRWTIYTLWCVCSYGCTLLLYEYNCQWFCKIGVYYVPKMSAFYT